MLHVNFPCKMKMKDTLQTTFLFLTVKKRTIFKNKKEVTHHGSVFISVPVDFRN